jgi:hypothetical protein
MLPNKDVVISAIKKDLHRRYISVVALQSDGRLELDRTCINLLSPVLGEEFSIINDRSSIIIARNPIKQHEDRVIATATYGSGIDGKTKWRLRLSKAPLRILLACKVGFRAFRYGDEVALEAEPFIPPAGSHIYSSSSIEELGPYILRSSRSILHIHCASANHSIFPTELGFKLIGEYWCEKYHQDIHDSSMSLLYCEGDNCKFCSKNLPIVKTTYWFPVIGYNFKQHYARPTLLSFSVPFGSSICEVLLSECSKFTAKKDKCNNLYVKSGNINFSNDNLFKIYYSKQGGINIMKLKSRQALTKEEKGLMKLSFKELESYIKEFDKKEFNYSELRENC